MSDSRYFSSSESPSGSLDHSMVERSDDFLRERVMDSRGEEEEGESDHFLPSASNISREATEEPEEQSNREAEAEVEDTRVDDTVREATAISVYHDTHPDLKQRHVGGREITENEAIWSVSSFRPHWGPDKLRDNNALTYWQSDCPNPQLYHTIDLAFNQATLIRQVSLFIDFFQDESYTPKTISIRVGTTYRDLQELDRIECDEFVGWVNSDITAKNEGNPFRVFKLQIAILSTHLNGRDTHIRQVKVYSVIPTQLDGTSKEKEQEQVAVKKSLTHKGIR